MHKTYMGVRLKTLREQRGITQAALAQPSICRPAI
jgi:DNA-binding XRE family transcriptional regulator